MMCPAQLMSLMLAQEEGGGKKFFTKKRESGVDGSKPTLHDRSLVASLAHLALEEGGGQLERVELVGKVVQAREELLRRSLVRVLNDEDDDWTWSAKAWKRRAYELNSTQLNCYVPRHRSGPARSTWPAQSPPAQPGARTAAWRPQRRPAQSSTRQHTIQVEGWRKEENPRTPMSSQ